MPFSSLFSGIEQKEKNQAIEKIIAGSTPSHDFFLMTILSILMATLGLLLNSVAVIIGSMLIAPILLPIASLGLGVTMADAKLIRRASVTLLKAVVLGVAAAAIATLFFQANGGATITPEIMDRIKPSLAYAAIAFIAGFAVSFALVKPGLIETLPGIAISVALIPPLAVVGIGIVWLNWTLINGALSLFLINIIGIVFANILNFSLMNFYAKKEVVQKIVKKEDERVNNESHKEK